MTRPPALVLVALALLLLPLPGHAAPSVVATGGLADLDYRPRIGSPLPGDLALTDEAGRPVRLSALLQGRPLVLALVYFRCPDLCGIVLADLAKALTAARLTAGRDYDLLAVSFDAREGPADAAASKALHLAQYSPAGAASGWHFLTAAPEEIARLEAAVGFTARFDAVSGRFAHPAGIVLATPDGRVASYLGGVGYRAGDLVLGLRNAGDGGVGGNGAQPVRLLCFHFDPVTGRYSLDVLLLVKAAALLTVATLGGTLYLAFRRDRR